MSVCPADLENRGSKLLQNLPRYLGNLYVSVILFLGLECSVLTASVDLDWSSNMETK